MEQFHALAPIIAHDIEQCTATYPNGMPWHSQVHPEAKRTRYTIRTWDGVARNDHSCWVKFHIQVSGDTSLVDADLCAPDHKATEFKQHVFKFLWKNYGPK